MTKSKMCRIIFNVFVVTLLLYPNMYYGCPTMCTCTVIRTSCVGKGLTEVPSGIPVTTDELDLSSNNITRLSVGVFTSYVNFIYLDLRDNQITSLPEGLFSNNPDLRSLMLTGNPLLCCNIYDLKDFNIDQPGSCVCGTCTGPQNTDEIALDEIVQGSFNTSVCPQVDGQWSDWSESNCSSICGVGNMTRTRECNNPEPSKYGQRCQGEASDVIPCYRDCSTGEEFNWKLLVIGLVVGACVIIAMITLVALCVLMTKGTKVSSGT